MSDLKFSVFPNENFVDLGLYQFGYERTDPSHSYGLAARNHYLFHYIISGSGNAVFDRAWRIIAFPSDRTSLSFFDAMLRSITPETGTHKKRLQDYYIHEALTYIEQNFQNDITVEDIAEICGLNHSYFGKIFKDSTGKTAQIKFCADHSAASSATSAKPSSLMAFRSM